MKKLTVLGFLLLALLSACGNEVDTEKVEGMEMSSEPSAFEEYLKLFPEIQLPYAVKSEDFSSQPGTPIPVELADSYRGNAQVTNAVGRIRLHGQYIALIVFFAEGPDNFFALETYTKEGEKISIQNFAGTDQFVETESIIYGNGCIESVDEGYSFDFDTGDETPIGPTRYIYEIDATGKINRNTDKERCD